MKPERNPRPTLRITAMRRAILISSVRPRTLDNRPGRAFTSRFLR
jgi:hypothetical protein